MRGRQVIGQVISQVIGQVIGVLVRFTGGRGGGVGVLFCVGCVCVSPLLKLGFKHVHGGLESDRFWIGFEVVQESLCERACVRVGDEDEGQRSACMRACTCM